MKSNNGVLTEKEIQERTSKYMQNLLAAIKVFSMSEIETIRNSDMHSVKVYGLSDPKCIVWMADQRDLDYAISIAPKTFKVKQG